MLNSDSSRRIRFTLLHLLICAAIAAVVGALVFTIWYPPPFHAIAGGLVLFGLIVGVDVVMGPALTLVVAAPKKPIAELRRDLVLIGLVQVAALVYGLHSIWVARPVYMVFEIDRMRAVTAADVDPVLLAQAAPAWRELPRDGPRWIAAVKPTDPDELIRSIELGLAGVDLGMLPANWREFADHRESAWAHARPVAELARRYPQVAGELQTIAVVAQTSLDELRFLPVVSSHTNNFVVVVDKSFRTRRYLPLDGFI